MNKQIPVVVDKPQIDHTRSSIEIFPALEALEDSLGLYFKFSKNLVKVTRSGEKEVMLMDFDLCLIDANMDETIIQLFAFFILSDQDYAFNDWKTIETAVGFARSLIVTQIEEKQLKDRNENTIVVPGFVVTPDSIKPYL